MTLGAPLQVQEAVRTPRGVRAGFEKRNMYGVSTHRYRRKRDHNIAPFRQQEKSEFWKELSTAAESSKRTHKGNSSPCNTTWLSTTTWLSW